MKSCRLFLIAITSLILIACQPEPESSPTPAYIPSPTPPPIPTDQPLSPTPQPTGTPTLTATASQTPLPPTATLTTTPAAYTVPSPAYTAAVTGVGPHLREVYQRGQELGNDGHRFSKVGDCHSSSPDFLRPVEVGDYNLGEYGYLESAIIHYAGSFGRVGQAALLGAFINTLLDPYWVNRNFCREGENRIECEYRLHQPSIALILAPPMLIGEWRPGYQADLRQVVELSLERGIIPVLTTSFHSDMYATEINDANAIIRQVGAEYNVPVWDFYTTSYALPDHADRGNWHMTISPDGSTDFSNADSMRYGMTLRNLEALQVLHMILNVIVE